MSDTRKTFVSRRKVAEALGISRQRLEKLIREGRIDETPAGIDLEKAKAQYEASLDAGRRAAYDAGRTGDLAAVPGQGPVVSFAEARTRKELAHADRAELDYKIKAGLYILRDEVRAREFEIARKLRDRILGLPARIANFVPAEAMTVIVDECEALIRELQDDAAAIAETTPIP